MTKVKAGKSEAGGPRPDLLEHKGEESSNMFCRHLIYDTSTSS